MVTSALLNAELMRRLFPDRTIRRLLAAVQSKRYKTPKYAVKYYLRDADDKVLLETQNRACFGDLGNYLKNRPATRYLTYCPHQAVEEDGSVPVPLAHCIRWAEIGQAIGLLPLKQTAKSLVTGEGIRIDLDAAEAIIPRIYMQLCWLRWIREGIGIVLHGTQLIDEAGCDPWAAIAYCHRDHVGYLDQSLYPFSTSIPGLGSHPANAGCDLGIVLQMHRLTHCPEEIDDRHLKTACINERSLMWGWQTGTTVPPRRFIVSNPEMMLSSEVYPVIASGSFKRAAELVEQLKRNGRNVTFEKTISS